MTKSRITALALALAASLGVAACGSSSSSSSTTSSSSSGTSSSSSGSATLNGAGSTLAAPIYQQWGSNLKSQGLTINYNPVGSGTGIADLQTATVTFAGSDPALKPTDTSGDEGPGASSSRSRSARSPFPTTCPGIKSGLEARRADACRHLLAARSRPGMMLAIKSLNPGLSLPSTAITVVHRSDSSGTTNGFTTYLSDVSPTWTSSIGSGKDVKWPVGTGAAKNSGVAAAVKQTAGAVGYVEQAYALENGFTYASVKNSAGTYVLPTISNTSAAADGVKVPPDLGISTINSPNPQAYPIVSQTFLVVYKDPCKAGGASSSVASGLKKFLTLRVRRRPADARVGLEPAPVRAAARPRWLPRTPRSWRR